MKNKYFLLLFLLISVLACTKTDNGKPTLSVESVTSVVPVDGILEVKMKFTQSNGKLSGGTLVAVRQRLNIIPTPVIDLKADTLAGATSTATPDGVIPNFPDKNKGEFVFTLDWSTLHEDDNRNDTLAIKFFAVDTQNDTSNIVITSPFTVLSQ